MKRLLPVVLVSVGLVVLGFGLWRTTEAPEAVVAEGTDVQPTINLDEKDLPQNVGESLQKDGYTITKELVPVAEKEVPLPVGYATVPSKPASMSGEQYAGIVAKLKPIIVDIQKGIEKNTKDGRPLSSNLYTDGWLDVALYKNALGDSNGARDVWVFLTKATPGLFQSYGNLANMYLGQQNFPEAVVWYKKAIEKKPDYLQYYQDLSDVYIAQKNTSAALEILKQGIAVDSTGWSLQVSLGRLYNSVGDINQAHIQFNNAIARAKKVGNTAAAEAIEQEKIYTQ
jgi:tetratricopeptide (TPR) repeat protein